MKHDLEGEREYQETDGSFFKSRYHAQNARLYGDSYTSLILEV